MKKIIIINGSEGKKKGYSHSKTKKRQLETESGQTFIALSIKFSIAYVKNKNMTVKVRCIPLAS